MLISLPYEKIFLAGGTGMVGSSIIRALNSYNPEFKKNNRLLTPSRNELNLLDKKELEEWFAENKPTVVIIAAAKVGGIIANNAQPASFLLENLKIQTNLIETAWKYRVKRLLFLGSSCIYPKFASQPIKEESLLQGSLEKTNEWYAIAKIAGMKLCESLRIQNDFDAISLMPTNLYGPNDNYDPINGHVMAAMIRRFREAAKSKSPNVTCWGTGNPLREFLHVDDLAEAIIFCLENWDPNLNNSPKKNNGEKLVWLNVGTGMDISIKDLAFKISNLMGYEGEIMWDKSKPDGTLKKLLCVERINKLGWKSKIKLEEGLTKTINYIDKGLEKNYS